MRSLKRIRARTAVMGAMVSMTTELTVAGRWPSA